MKRPILVATYTVALVCVLALLFLARDTVFICLIGLGIGTLISPVLQILRKKLSLPKAVGALVLVISFLGFATVLGYTIFAMLAEQITSLTQKAPEIANNLQRIAGDKVANFPWINTQIAKIDFAAASQKAIGYFFMGLSSSVEAISGLVFALLLGIYTAIGAEPYYNMAIEGVPPAKRSRVSSFLHDCAKAIRSWFGAQLIDMLLVGTITACALLIIGVDYWLLFGLLTAIFGIIPYVGILIVVVIASLITLASQPENFWWVIGTYFITQQIEGNVILPLVMRGRAELPEVPLLVFMLMLGSWMGLVGVFLAPPIFAVTRVAIRHFYLPAIGATPIPPGPSGEVT